MQITTQARGSSIPALFVLLNKYLSRSFNDLFSSNSSMYYEIPKGIPLSHLVFADDCIIFCNGCKESILKLKKVLQLYEVKTGQKINLDKSGFLPGKRAIYDMLSSTLAMPVMTFPFTYLGAPLAKGKYKKLLFAPVIDKIRVKLLGWNLDLLSQGSRLTLIKIVLNAPVYLIQTLNPPKGVLVDICRFLARFF